MQRPHRALLDGRRLRLAAVLPLAFFGLTCREQATTGPGLPGRAALAIAPSLARAEGEPVVEIVRAAVKLVRISNGQVAVDTVAAMPAGGELSLDLQVLMTRASEEFELRVRTLDATSDTAYSGTQRVTIVRDDENPAPVAVPMTYTGRDTIVATLGVEPRDTTFRTGDAITLRAVARRTNGSTVAGARVGWLSREPAKISVNASTGQLTAHGTFSDVWIVATTLNGRRDSTRVSSGPHGLLRGRVFAVSADGATSTPLAGATVRFVSGDGRATTVTTGADGAYVSPALRTGTYTVTVSHSGYVAATLFGAEVTEDGDRTLANIPIVPANATAGSIAGRVASAISGFGIANATVELRGGIGAGGSALQTTTSAADGTYRFDGVAAGTYTVRASAPGFATNERTAVSVGGGVTVSHDLALAESGPGVAIVLTWGTAPADLDAHLTGPVAGGGRFHVYYGNDGSLTSAPFAQLDIDDTNGGGPETIRISQEFPGVYRYQVHDFTNAGSTASEALGGSQAQVKVYRAGALVAEFAVPPGSGTVWTVFEMSGGVITPVNTLSAGSPAADVTASGRLRRKTVLTVP